MSAELNILLLLGSVRSDRLGIRLATFLTERVRACGHQPVLADPVALELPMLDRMYKEYEPGTAPADMESLAQMIRAADGVIVVSAEYNHGIPPALKNMLDHYLEEWYHKPSAIACYSAGSFGGVRAAMALRMTLAELGMPTISSLLPVPKLGNVLDPRGVDQTEYLTEQADNFIKELTWWAAAAKDHTARFGPPF